MPNTEEQRKDIIENCNVLLTTILGKFRQTDDTPEGRMIAQLIYLRERAENFDLPLPVEPNKLSTLRKVYIDGELCRYASSPGKKHAEIEIYMERLLNLTKKARLLYKDQYKPYALRCLKALAALLEDSIRPLNNYEKGLINELSQIKQLFLEGVIEVPIENYYPNYPNFREVHSLTGNSVDDLRNGKLLIDTVAEIFFEGTRPDSWLTTEDADRETEDL